MKKNDPTKKSEKRKGRFVEKVADGLDIPKETMYNMPFITLIGNEEIQIENFLNIVAYGEKLISLKTQCGLLSIEGDKLVAKNMNSDEIRIRGKIKNIGFMS